MLDEGLSIGALGDAGEVLDQQATNEYRKAIEDFKEEYVEAEKFNDTERAAQLSEKIQFIEAQLTGAYGLGGRTRKAGDISDRARKAISVAVSRSLSRIGDAHPSLERHLRNSIKTGTFCSYCPDSPTPWDH